MQISCVTNDWAKFLLLLLQLRISAFQPNSIVRMQHDTEADCVFKIRHKQQTCHQILNGDVLRLTVDDQRMSVHIFLAAVGGDIRPKHQLVDNKQIAAVHCRVVHETCRAQPYTADATKLLHDPLYATSFGQKCPVEITCFRNSQQHVLIKTENGAHICRAHRAIR